jgi:predicted amidohydrolase
MRVGVFQCAAGDFTADQRLERLAEAIGHRPIDLAVCPELFACGYHVGAGVREQAETADGSFAHQVAALAHASATAIIYGHPERDGEGLYNAASCIDRQGRRILTRRKLVLPPGFEGEVFSPGDDAVSTFDLEGVRCAILICYEAEFPEAVRAVARAGAELVAVPTALAAQWHGVAHRLIPTRAFENGVWLLYANYAGEADGIRYLGASCIVAPDGRDIARAGSEEQFISARIDCAAVEAARKRLPYLEDVVYLRSKLG